MSANVFFVRQYGKVRGPFTADQVSRLVGAGMLSPAAELSTDRAAWRSVATHPALTPPASSPAAALATADQYELDLSGLPAGGASRKSATGSEWFDGVDLNSLADG